MDNIKTTYQRDIYDIIDLFASLGGIHDIFISVLGILIFPISKFSYHMKVFEKLYLVKTKYKDLMNIKSMKKKNNKIKYYTKRYTMP